jgi:hypothetical protein
MENEISKAVTELTDLNELLIEISRKPTIEVIEIITQNNPDYLEAVKATGEMPEKTLDLVMDYGIWNLFRLHSIYEAVWDKAIKTYYESPSAPGGPMMVKALWTHVEMVIKG